VLAMIKHEIAKATAAATVLLVNGMCLFQHHVSVCYNVEKACWTRDIPCLGVYGDILAS
jgi:hypothetical protein